MSEERVVLTWLTGTIAPPIWPSQWGALIHADGTREPKFFPHGVKMTYADGTVWPDDFPDGAYPPVPDLKGRCGLRQRPSLLSRLLGLFAQPALGLRELKK